MPFGFGSVASLVRSVCSSGGSRAPRSEYGSANVLVVSIGQLSAAAQAALAPLDLPPDGPLDHTVRLRPKLTAEIAASNFVCWAQALDLMGIYSRRRIYALYCEFSEVDNRTPLRDTHLLEALSQTEGVRREQLCAAGRGSTLGPYQWIIEPATNMRAESSELEIQEPNAPTASIWSEAPQTSLQPTPTPQSQTAPTPTGAILSRLLFDDDHPFSPAKLREQEKSARRARFISAASRKQRGALRRAA